MPISSFVVWELYHILSIPYVHIPISTGNWEIFRLLNCRKLFEISKSILMDCHTKTMSLIFLNWWTVWDNLLLSSAYTPRLRTVTQINWVTSKPHIKRKQTILTFWGFYLQGGLRWLMAHSSPDPELHSSPSTCSLAENSICCIYCKYQSLFVGVCLCESVVK